MDYCLRGYSAKVLGAEEGFKDFYMKWWDVAGQELADSARDKGVIKQLMDNSWLDNVDDLRAPIAPGPGSAGSQAVFFASQADAASGQDRAKKLQNGGETARNTAQYRAIPRITVFKG